MLAPRRDDYLVAWLAEASRLVLHKLRRLVADDGQHHRFGVVGKDEVFRRPAEGR